MAFQSELKAVLRDHAFWSRMRTVGQLICIFAPLLGIFLLWRLGESIPVTMPTVERPENVQPNAVAGIHWINELPGLQRRRRVLLAVHLMSTVGLTVGLYWWSSTKAIPMNMQEKLAWLIGICMLSIVLIDLYLILHGTPSWRMRVGTDGNKLLLDHGKGEKFVEAYPFTAVITNGRELLVGRHLIPLRTPMGLRFDRDEIAGYVLARMPKSSYVSAPEFVRRTLQGGNRPMWAVVILSAALILFLSFSRFFAGDWTTLLSRIVSWLIGS
jgi:hypothetical protein